PFEIPGHAQPARPPGAVLEHQPRDLHGVVGGDELEQVERDAVRGVLVAAVPGTVAHEIGRVLLADGEGGRAPDLVALLVSYVDHLAGRIADGIVRPRGQLVLVTVERPRVAG